MITAVNRMHVSPRGRDLIKQFEGFRAHAYLDPVGVWTIGYGFTRGVQPGVTMTLAQAEARLITELLSYEAAVMAACTVRPNQHQFDALCSLAWNIGAGAVARSSVIRAHNRGDFQSAARAFGLWNRAGGREWPGLTRRRAAEAALYLEPVPGLVRRVADAAVPPAWADHVPPPPAQDMPQAVDPESSLTASPINRAASAAATTAAGLGALSQIKDSLADLQGWLVPALALTVVALAGYIVWQRWQQRQRGWA